MALEKFLNGTVARLLAASAVGALVAIASTIARERKVPPLPSSVSPPLIPVERVASEIPEASKLLMEHRLQVRRILLDRLLIGALLVVAGGLASLWIERFKSDATRAQFFLEKRLESSHVVTAPLSRTIAATQIVVDENCTKHFDPDGKSRVKLNEHIAELSDAINSQWILLEDDFFVDATQILSIFHGFATQSDEPTEMACDQRDFLAAVAAFISQRTRSQYVPESKGKATFTPIKYSDAEMSMMGNKLIFHKNFQAWMEARSK